MKFLLAVLLTVLLTMLLPIRSLFAADSPSFDYDKKAPLDPREQEVAVRNGVRVSMLTYANPAAGGRADAMLVAPVVLKGRTAAIIWIHSGGYYNQLSDAVLMADAGAVSLLVNAAAPAGEGAEAYRDSMIATVINLRRAVDLLSARPGIDPQRIAFVGHSFGAMMGTVAGAVDKRFKAGVFEVGLLGMSIHLRTSPHPWAAGVRKGLGDKLENFLRVIEPVDAVHYVGKLAPTVLLFQSARIDPGVPDKDAQDFFDAASEPKELKWYDTGHEVLDIRAISDRARFLAKQLGLPPVEPILKAKIGVK